MTTPNKKSSNDPADQLRNDALRHQRDDDLRDDDVITNKNIADSKLPKSKGKETLNNDLDKMDLIDDDEANFDVHQVKNDQFGSLEKSIKNKNDHSPDPDEIPEEHQSGDGELDYPDEDRMEKGSDDEVTYHEPKEVTPPAPSEGKPHARHATLNNLDKSFTDQTHGRTSGRMIDHEPGTPNNL
jgi:hypothetical protein